MLVSFVNYVLGSWHYIIESVTAIFNSKFKYKDICVAKKMKNSFSVYIQTG